MVTAADSDWRVKAVRDKPEGLEVEVERVGFDFNFPAAPANDPVNHPAHYNHYQGLEIIDLTEQMNFNKGNAVKYIARAGLKNPDTEVEDLEKAVWYLQREIDRIRNRP